MYVSKWILFGWLILILRLYNLLVLIWLLNLVHKAVINGLVGLFVGESEPGTVEGAFLYWFATSILLPHQQQYSNISILNAPKPNLYFLVIIYSECLVTEVVHVRHVEIIVFSILWVDLGKDFTSRV